MREDILGAIIGGIAIGALGVGVLMIPYISNNCVDYKAQLLSDTKFANEVGWQLRYSGVTDASGVIPTLPSPDVLAKISHMLGCTGFSQTVDSVLFKPDAESTVSNTGSQVFTVKGGNMSRIPKAYCKFKGACMSQQ